MTEPRLDGETLSILHRWGFDAETFAKQQQSLGSETIGQRENRLGGVVEPPPKGAVATLPDPGTARHREHVALGEDALRRGAVGSLVLAGGMATRFGGVVKALVPAIDGRTFLDLKVRDAEAAAARAGARVPLLVMSSFATDEAIRDALDGRDDDDGRVPSEVFPQGISVRLSATGEVFIGDDGAPSLYAPGHGDLSFALRRSGALQRFREAGGELLCMSNVDNLLATIDPAVIGAHIASEQAMTVECVRKDPGDKGGAPALVDGHLEIVEAFRFPETFDQDSIDVFNTNTLLFSAAAIDRDFDLDYFVVNKSVDGRDVVQFERLVGQLTAFLPSHFLEVPRTGPHGRFAPVKDPAELERRRPEIEQALKARGVLAA